jgi:hypothetical protein
VWTRLTAVGRTAEPDVPGFGRFNAPGRCSTAGSKQHGMQHRRLQTHMADPCQHVEEATLSSPSLQQREREREREMTPRCKHPVLLRRGLCVTAKLSPHPHRVPRCLRTLGIKPTTGCYQRRQLQDTTACTAVGSPTITCLICPGLWLCIIGNNLLQPCALQPAFNLQAPNSSMPFMLFRNEGCNPCSTVLCVEH